MQKKKQTNHADLFSVQTRSSEKTGLEAMKHKILYNKKYNLLCRFQGFSWTIRGWESGLVLEFIFSVSCALPNRLRG